MAFCTTRIQFYCFTLRTLLVVLLAGGTNYSASAQCPVNIDFENGTLDGWTCWTGNVASVNDQNVISLSVSGPAGDRHAMLSSNPGDGRDPYGDFPVNCPNGSGHSIKLGNINGGNQAEGVSYEFTIPANKDIYSLIYHYAVVFQDPNHLESQQPRMEIVVTNVTDNQIITCSSFAFHPYGSVLPGFQLSANPGSSTPVWFKDWSAVSINLDKMAGKRIQLFFKSADCTFQRHFGYAYVDVNSECSGEFVGAAFCPDDTAVNVVGPYGYQDYKWFNSTFTNILGVGQTLRLSPPPTVGTTIGVEVVPYNGYGCLDTLYAKLLDTLTVNAHAGPDMLSCNRTPVQLGTHAKPGLVYAWTPAAGLSSASISNPIAKPSVTTNYIVAASSSGGGCRTTDTVLVKASLVDDSITVVGKPSFCITSRDSAVLTVRPEGAVQWYKDNVAVIGAGAHQSSYHVPQSGSGTYYAHITNSDGCSVVTAAKTVYIETPKQGITYPIKFAVTNLPLDLKARPVGDTAFWKPGFSLDKPVSFTPVFKGISDQSYYIDIKTKAGCVTTDTQFVKIVGDVQVYVPNAFSPNRDGKNEVLRPMLRGIKDFHYFKVFNRWGKLLFETNQEWAGWDGYIGGAAQSPQTVVWVVEGIGVDGLTYKRNGSSVLIR